MQNETDRHLWQIKADIEKKRVQERQLKKDIDKLLKEMKLFQTNRLVARFNAKYPVGSKVFWRLAEIYQYQEYTVKQAAFVHQGRALVYFQERSGYCSIDPIFIQKNLKK